MRKQIVQTRFGVLFSNASPLYCVANMIIVGIFQKIKLLQKKYFPAYIYKNLCS